MKICITFFLLFFLGLKLDYCQNKINLSIPIVKEIPLVDSVIKYILNGKVAPTLSGRSTNNKWIVFDIDSAGSNGFSIFAVKVNEGAINLIVNRITPRKTAFGFFEYDGYFIFVQDDKAFNSFYKKLTKVKTFGFLHKLKHLQVTPEITKDQEWWSYNYKNGIFSLQKGPTIR